MSFMKLMGVGLTLAIVMDATVVRGLLVPAFMRLAGDAMSMPSSGTTSIRLPPLSG